MSGFTAAWLALREPFDAAARATPLITKLRAHVALGTSGAPLEVLDLGAGAGSNLRSLAPLLGGVQRWRLADHDPRLLDAAIATTHAWAEARGAQAKRAAAVLTIDAGDFVADVRCEPVELTELGAIDWPSDGLVTAAALLDLVSNEWLDALAARCHAARAAVCFALTYDGRTTATPAEPEDTEALELFNEHQLGDKGFGPALGPRAAAAGPAFAAHGYELLTAASDWLIGPRDAELQLALLDGWLGAACEIAPNRAAALRAWHERRRAHVTAGRSQLRVGHLDLVGWL